MVSKVTLYHKINDCCDKALYKIIKQRLTAEKKKFIKSWILKIQLWKFLSRVTQLQEIVTELLQAKDDN